MHGAKALLSLQERVSAGPRRARRREHMAMDAQVRAARAAADNYADDIAATTAHVHAAAAAREDAKRDLAVCRHQVRVWAHACLIQSRPLLRLSTLSVCALAGK